MYRRAGLPTCLVAAAATALACVGCGPTVAGGTAGPGMVDAVGAENQYADVISQIGGRYVHTSAILDNPNTDPHTFESSPSVARQVGDAQLIVQNGLGYDSFMDKIESATSGSRRQVIVVAHLLGRPASTPNPHLWYDPATMPVVAAAVEADLAAIQPAHAAYFQANLGRFDTSLQPWLAAIAAFKRSAGGATVATTEPVADYTLQALGMDDLTPFRFQAAVMNGTDPTPQDISFEEAILANRKVAVFCYNAQVVDPLTKTLRNDAVAHGVPVVAVYETMPAPGYDYQSWMVAEVAAIQKAVTQHTSTDSL